MKISLLENLYYVLIYPEEYPYFYQEIRSAFSEVIANIIVSLSLAISMIYISPPYSDKVSFSFLFFLIMNFVFFNLHPFLHTLLIDYKLNIDIDKETLHKLISFSRYSIVVFAASLPLSHIFVFLKLTGGAYFLFILFLLVILNLFVISKGFSSIYKISTFECFRKAISSVLSIFYLSIFIMLYFIIFLLGVFV